MFIKSVVKPNVPIFNPFPSVLIAYGRIGSLPVLSSTLEQTQVASSVFRYLAR